jgi:hypothetical protein
MAEEQENLENTIKDSTIDLKKLDTILKISGMITSLANLGLWSIGAICAMDYLTNKFPEKENLYWMVPSVTALGIVGLCSVEYLGEKIIRHFTKRYKTTKQK